MKKIFIILYFVSIISIFPQNNGVNPLELYFVTVNIPPIYPPAIYFTLTAQSNCWNVAVSDPRNYYLDDTYDDQSLRAPINDGETTDGFNFVTSGPQLPMFEYGIYKVTNSINGFYFYLDYRDDRYCNGTDGGQIDIWIKYDSLARTWQYRNEPDGGTYPETWHNIALGEVLNSWSILNLGTTPETNQFPQYWNYSLVVIDEGDNHPTLLWGTNPNFSATKYNIYRQFGSEAPHFILSIYSTTTFTWEDMNINLTSTPLGATYISYYVKAANNNDQESDSTYKFTVDILNGGVRPAKPTNFTVTNSPASHPYLSWTLNSELDVYYNISNGYILERRIKSTTPPGTWSSWTSIPLNGNTNHYEDTYINNSGGGNHLAEYRLKAFDNVFYSDTTDPLDIPYGISSNKIVGKNKNIDLTTYNLIQNFPNPFNPTSQISFSIPEAAFVQLKVYDMFGREITTLVTDFLPEGIYNYEFNGKNLASGVYFYTLKAGNYTESKKMILSK
jgi:hypothetical protein